MQLKAFWPPILIAIGIFLMVNVLRNNGSPLFFFSGITFLCFSIIGLALIKEGDYAISTIKTIEKSIKNRGLLGWVIGLALTCFYILLYWYPEHLGLGSEQEPNTGLIRLFDGLSLKLQGRVASQWFVYSCFYTIAVVTFGIKFIIDHHKDRYQVTRTISVVFFQLVFAFLIPAILSKFNPDANSFNMDMKNMWPLNYYFFEDWHIQNMLSTKSLGLFFLVLGLLMIFVLSPLLTYFYGKRWYCSWVCGCGALAETAGDSFRHLSSKTKRAWNIERWSINLVLVFIFITTIAVINTSIKDIYGLGESFQNMFLFFIIFLMVIINLLVTTLNNKKKTLPQVAINTMYLLTAIIVVFIAIYCWDKENILFGIDSYQLRKWYGFLIGALFSGVIGVGFYPLLGNRVWCRYGCPMAAILGLQQKLFTRFRISSNGGQCIACGNCTTACEMGIDVRAYAMKSESIQRASCVGCGLCASVCPRGVLKLENIAD